MKKTKQYTVNSESILTSVSVRARVKNKNPEVLHKRNKERIKKNPAVLVCYITTLTTTNIFCTK